ncbi:MAG: hypothetical protein RL494_157 [Bacteroidota bacterium]|jgi:hypothetical protein
MTMAKINDNGKNQFQKSMTMAKINNNDKNQ